LAPITPANVQTLARAWEFDTEVAGSQFTPLVIDGVMYLSNTTHLIALAPETGRIIYKVPHEGISRRGLAYWPGDGTIGARFFSGASGGRMVAIDVRTGQRAHEFGVNGYVDLRALALIDGGTGNISLNSPPAVYRHVVITSGSNGEGAPGQGRPYGDVHGWDVRTGAHLWTFHTVPRPGEPGHDTWPPNAWRNRGGTNAWGFMTVDEERGLVYVPTGVATDDWYGGDRHGDNLYANSIVALDALTGKLRWHQQLVHHDIWNYDTPTAPVLMDVNVSGKGKIPGLFQVTKQSWVYSFNRHTGEPIWPIVERPAPRSLVPEERLAATQPHVTKPAPFDLQGRTEEHLIDYTPEIRKLALARAKEMDLLAPLFAAPTHRGNKEGRGPANICPGGGGGANITGPPAADPVAGILFITSTSGCSPTLLAPASERDNDKMTGKTLAAWITSRGEKPPPVKRDNDPLAGIPDIFKGPSGRLVAIDMNTGEHLWMTPHGDSPTTQQEAMRNNPLLKGVKNLDTNWGRRGHAALAATSTLLFATGQTADNAPKLFAIDKKSGKRVGAVATPRLGQYGLMTYMHAGKQYIVVQTGSARRKQPGALVALALP
jgi:quinoprotein glucose dehydrogenase